MHRASEDEIQEAQREYKKRYAPFRPFKPSAEDLSHVSFNFASLVSTQNGQDTDDYCVYDDNKVEKYMGNLPSGSRVLLLGVGTGRETLVAKDLGYSAVGTTLGSRNIDFGLSYLGLSAGEHIECLNEALPFGAEEFDMVAGFQVFEHTLAPLLFLLEQSRVLKRGGTLLLEWPPADKYTMEDNPHHQVCFTPGQAYALFQKAGFGNIEILYDDLNPIPKEDWWRGDQTKMLVVKGTKVPCYKDYVQRAWVRR